MVECRRLAWNRSLKPTNCPKGKTWSSGWGGYGTNLPAFISPNGLTGQTLYVGGWGFGPVRRAGLTSIYRRATSNLRSRAINKFEDGTYTPRFQNTGLFMSKYAARKRV